MENPDVTIASITFTDRQSFVHHNQIVTIAEISYDQDGVDYPLKVSGEALTQAEALQNALTTMTWAIALDSQFTDEEVRLLKVAHKLKLEQGAGTWYIENVLAHLAHVDMQMRIESNPVRMLTKVGLMLQHIETNRTLFRLSDFGQYIVESHHQFQVTD